MCSSFLNSNRNGRKVAAPFIKLCFVPVRFCAHFGPFGEKSSSRRYMSNIYEQIVNAPNLKMNVNRTPMAVMYDDSSNFCFVHSGWSWAQICLISSSPSVESFSILDWEVGIRKMYLKLPCPEFIVDLLSVLFETFWLWPSPWCC